MKKLTVLLTLFLLVGAGYAADKARVLYEAGGVQDLGEVKGADAKFAIGKGFFKVKTSHSESWPGITIKAPREKGKWDLSEYEWLAAEVKNTGDKITTFYCRVDNPGADGRENCLTVSAIPMMGRPKAESPQKRRLKRSWTYSSGVSSRL